VIDSYAHTDVDACAAELLHARIDGNRNIIHAAVLMCAPVDNARDTDRAYGVNIGADQQLSWPGM
jgi:hypothetical protein